MTDTIFNVPNHLNIVKVGRYLTLVSGVAKISTLKALAVLDRHNFKFKNKFKQSLIDTIIYLCMHLHSAPRPLYCCKWRKCCGPEIGPSPPPPPPTYQVKNLCWSRA